MARSNETYGMTWSEIDFDKRLWSLPANRTKQGRPHTVPLSDRAMAILALQKQCSSNEFVFSGWRRTRLASNSMRDVLRGMQIRTSVHGFRSVFKDYMGNETHFAREPVEECLGHAIGNRVEQAYRRLEALAKRRVILDHWAEYCG